jgi:RES domain-containing protein
MVHDPRLLDAVESLALGGTWTSTVWRQTIGKRDPLVPNSRGARWNPPATDALYCALSESGARAEVANLLGRQPIATSKPLVMSQLDVVLTRVADIRSAPALDALGFDPAALLAAEWDDARRVGGATAWLGFAGLLVPSARHDDGNLVVFVNNLDPGDRIELRHPVG